MQNLHDLQNYYALQLSSIYNVDEINAIFAILVEEYLKIERAQYLIRKFETRSQEEITPFLETLEILRTGKPVQHILQKADFFGEKLWVTPDVLIPRQETEELVQLILQDHKNNSSPDIMDIGTGSGAIPLLLKKHLPSAEVKTMDISSEAIAVARKNADHLGLHISFLEADIMEWEILFNEEKFDIIVSNPPYITPEEKIHMHENVLKFEPHLALFVEAEAPLIFYDVISSFALQHLKSSGTLYFEINQYLANETKELLIKKNFKSVEIIQDLNGADRFIRAKIVGNEN